MQKQLLTSLILLAFLPFGAEAGPVKITALPYTIVVPGSYELVSNLSYMAPPLQGGQLPPFALFGGSAAIIINVTTPGAVTLNLKGFTLSGGLSFGDGIYVVAGKSCKSINPIYWGSGKKCIYY